MKFMKSAAWLLALLALGLFITGCGGGDSNNSTPPALTFTNGDSIPELTGVPTVPAALTITALTATPTFDITVPVDTDTAGINILWGEYSATSFNFGGAGSATVTAGTAQNVTVTIDTTGIIQTAGGKTVQVLLCNTAGNCNFTNTGIVGFYTEGNVPGTFMKATWSGGTAGMGSAVMTETGVALPITTLSP